MVSRESAMDKRQKKIRRFKSEIRIEKTKRQKQIKFEALNPKGKKQKAKNK